MASHSSNSFLEDRRDSFAGVFPPCHQKSMNVNKKNGKYLMLLSVGFAWLALIFG